MALMLLSIVLSMVLGAVVWLVIGSRLPWHAEQKLPVVNNIAYYALALFLPIYLTIFFIFE